MTDFKEYDDKDFRKEMKRRWEMRMEMHGRGGRVWMGVFLVAVGVVALLKSMMVPMPVWLYTWQMLLIAFGFFMGLRHGLRPGGWLIPILIGGLFLADQYFFQGQLRYHIWPVVIIILGVLFMIKSRRRKYCRVHWMEKMEKKRAAEAFKDTLDEATEDYNTNDYVDITSVFSGTKKNILSKNFKGGDIVNVFGGTELNLTQADFSGQVTLDVTAVFGGAKLIIPSNWTVRSELTNIFGGIQDKRSLTMGPQDPEKVLLLDGTVFFGGIEISSY